MLPPPTPKTYTITSSATEGGSISPLGETTVTEGASQSFTITPNEGYEISDVLVDGESAGVLTAYTFTDIKANHTISAVFAQENQPPAPSAPSNPSITKYTITVSISDGGMIDPPGSIQVNKGTSQTFNIMPFSPCYEIDDVLVDGESVGTEDTYTFTNIQKNHTIEAVFSSNPVAHNTRTNLTYDLIQDAIDNAMNGDTIIVCPGTYQENISFIGTHAKNITVQSADPLDPDIVENTIIEADDEYMPVASFGESEAILKGFTIQGSSAGGILIYQNNSVTIANNIIKDNVNVGSGGGIAILENTSPVNIFDNTIDNNSGHKGGGIYAASCSGDILISGGNVIKKNKPGTSQYGGGIYLTENTGTIRIEGNTIEENEGGLYGGGILLARCSSDTNVISNIIQKNTANIGGGIYVTGFSPDITSNQILENTAVSRAGGIKLHESSATISGNTIDGNKAQNGRGGGISIMGGTGHSNPTIIDNTISNNQSYHEGAGICVLESSDLMPETKRPDGWGKYGDTDYRQSIPPYDNLPIAGNSFSGNIHTDAPEFGVDVHFQRNITTLFFDGFETNDFTAGLFDPWTVSPSGSFPNVQGCEKYDGDYAACIGDGGSGLFESDTETNSASIERTVAIPSDAVNPGLSIYYWVNGTERGESYDWMKFFINDDEIFYVWEDSSDWQEFTYDLSSYIGNSFVLKIIAWTLDEEVPVYYYIDNIEIYYY